MIKPEELKRTYYYMILTRRFDDRCRNLYRAGQILGNYFSSIGQEATTVVPGVHLKKEDFVGPAHRELGCILAKGAPLKLIAAQILSRTTSLDHGRCHPNFFGWTEGRHLVPDTCLPSQVPVSVGAALAFKMRGEPYIAINFVGEGATSKGEYHESCNFAGVHKLPVIFVIQNNWYAESVPLHLQAGVEDLSLRAKGYGFAGVRVDGNDVVKMYEVFDEAVARAREGGGPTLVQCDTYRWYGHSEIDQAEYRSKDEVQDWMKKDPVPRFEKYLEENKIMTRNEMNDIITKVDQEIDEAVDLALESPEPTAADYDPVAQTYAP